MEEFKPISERKIYTSHFTPSRRAIEVLQKGKILSEGETPIHMIERVVSALTEIESKFGTDPKEIEALAKEFGLLLDEKYCVMSTPVLTNAGRYLEKPLSACTVPSIDLAHDDITTRNTKLRLARPARFERAALCLEGKCSIQLSYGRDHLQTTK